MGGGENPIQSDCEQKHICNVIIVELKGGGAIIGILNFDSLWKKTKRTTRYRSANWHQTWRLEKSDKSTGKTGDEASKIATHQLQTETLIRDNMQPRQKN